MMDWKWQNVAVPFEVSDPEHLATLKVDLAALENKMREDMRANIFGSAEQQHDRLEDLIEALGPSPPR